MPSAVRVIMWKFATTAAASISTSAPRVEATSSRTPASASPPASTAVTKRTRSSPWGTPAPAASCAGSICWSTRLPLRTEQRRVGGRSIEALVQERRLGCDEFDLAAVEGAAGPVEVAKKRIGGQVLGLGQARHCGHGGRDGAQSRSHVDVGCGGCGHPVGGDHSAIDQLLGGFAGLGFGQRQRLDTQRARPGDPLAFIRATMPTSST